MYNKKKSRWKLKLLFIVMLIVLAFVGLFHFSPSSYEGLKEDVCSKFGISTKVETPDSDSVKSVIKTDTLTIRPKNVSTAKIPLEFNGNCAFLFAHVNGYPIKFMIDTGCSDIHMSLVELLYLSHMGVIDADSTSGVATCVYADGSQHECNQYILKKVKVGDITVENVTCTVEETSTKEDVCLLGTSVLKQLGNVSIDYKNHFLLIN